MHNQPASPQGSGETASTRLELVCQQCGRKLLVDGQSAGGRVQCPACGQIQPARAVAQPPARPSGVTPPGHSPELAGTAIGGDVADSGKSSNSPIAPRSGTGPSFAAPPTVGPTITTQLKITATDELQDEAKTETKRLFDRILGEIAKLYVGQDELVLGTLVALFSSGHVLIESVPGLGKTLFVRTLGRVLGCDFGRIQFTADLMPSDITGAPIFDMKTQEFRFRPGPVFTQLLLADEINRSPAKTHAALLEIMQEFRVTIDGTSHKLNRPFLVLATQNPIESEGTYNLPEAQLDRFMFKLVADYPAKHEEAEILKLHSRQADINQRLEDEVQTVTSPDEIMRLTRENGQVSIDDKLINYINDIVRLTREWPGFHMGASPRAGLALMQGARHTSRVSWPRLRSSRRRGADHVARA